MPDAAATRLRSRAALRFVFVVALVDSISFGIMFPVLPNLIKQLTGGNTAQASEWTVVFAVAWGFMQFVCGPALGLLSDRFGRRPVLLISLFGLGVDFLVMAFAPNLWWLLFGRVLNGLTASSFSVANAYVADITMPDQRARNFGWLSAAYSLGFLIGPTLGGVLGEYSLRLPFMVAAVLTFTNLLYGAFLLPESLKPESRSSHFDLRRANPLGALQLLRSHSGLLGLAGVGFLFQLSQTALPTIFVLYAGYRYGWTPGAVGLVLAVVGGLGILVQMFLVGPVVTRIGERGALLLGCLGGAAGFAIFAVAQTGWIYIAGLPVFELAGFLLPGLMGLMSRRVAPSEQGQLQGASQSLRGISAMIGPPIFGLTFAWSLNNEVAFQAPGLALGVASALLMAAFLLALRVAQPAAVPVAEGEE